ncbi:sugar-transfer associated ATP-grasp domain-containing protein [Alkalibacillus haloalkaliphilus]|uniref:sugar-transfer associated ATP-grasp domain-containing protein n=1 Tax=Alkalibacillus haloalkaliphilus TaxID=94136 RepID=UPI0029354D25|nr:sugar-transfer associated ATP-grasp domain-containing protein [Alkalibacillus haloalkaliphilus]MDV2582850.1 sugar-transfer associated ATP-grasp domain-containing protein [Alkalibacillus haloalkaliphilus]
MNNIEVRFYELTETAIVAKEILSNNHGDSKVQLEHLSLIEEAIESLIESCSVNEEYYDYILQKLITIKGFIKNTKNSLIINTDIEGLERKVVELGKHLDELLFRIKYNNFYFRTNINLFSKLSLKLKDSGLLEDFSQDEIDQIKSFWIQNEYSNVDPSLSLSFKKLGGKNNEKVVPQNIYNQRILPMLNDLKQARLYSDKSIYDNLFYNIKSPQVVLKCVRGKFFDRHNKEVSIQNAFRILLKERKDLIIKPNLTDDGIKVQKLLFKNGQFYFREKPMRISDIISYWGENFIIQHVIQQHQIMANPHPKSVNTLRMVTLRWNKEVHHILSFARFGTKGLVNDNAGSGGVCVGINSEGELMDFAIDENAEIYHHHPTTNYDFSRSTKIPEFEKCKNFVKELHQNVLSQDFISWDIAISEKGEPIFIELNFRGAIWLYQLTTLKPLLGDFTEEVLRKAKDYNDNN